MENAFATMKPVFIREDLKLPIQVSQPFLTQTLTPYKSNVKYLRFASIDTINIVHEEVSRERSNGLIIGTGIFSIPSSCYIDDTGHFNSVEFNICYNQLAYVIFGNCLQADLFKKIFPSWQQKTDLCYEVFLDNQLSSMYIAKLDGKFIKPMDSKKFFGKLTLNRVVFARKITFLDTSISFSDDQGIKAMGSVLLAYNSNTNKQTISHAS